MRNRTLGITALVLTCLGLAATASLFAFEPGLGQIDWLNPEAAATGVAAICVVGCALGVASFKTRPGLAAAIIGALLVAFFVYQLCRSDAPTLYYGYSYF